MVDENPVNNVFDSCLKREGGYILLPECSGLGVKLKKQDINSEFLPRNLENIPLCYDGSSGYSV